MSYQAIKFSIANNVARITLARPSEANALNFTMSEELLEVATLCQQDKNVRAIILSAEGKIFCGGGDVRAFAAAGKDLPATLRRLLDTFHPAVVALSTMNAPVIASVQGVAAGAGLSLLASCSFVLASEKASFTMAYTGIGMTPDGSATYFLPRQVGLRRAEELMVTNRRLSAEEAREWGLVNQVVEAAELAGATEQLAADLAAGPTLAYGSTRRLLLATFNNSFGEQLAAEEDAIVAMASSRDGLDGVAAFSEKREPQFTGQ